jgi:hypothetical protein
MSNLLEKASILLTPTAYDDGKILSVKPIDGSGDFQFTRNSDATRVNSAGLIESLQTLSSNLVSNGDFSQEGPELITNGDFATDSDWTLGTGWSISGNKGVAALANNTFLQQNQTTIANKTYKVVYTLSDYENGSVRFQFSGGGGNILGTTASANGTYTEYIKSTLNHTIYRFKGTSSEGGFTGSIDNVSVKEVGQDWTLGTDWSIGDNKATKVAGSINNGIEQPNIFTNGKKYKLNFTVSDYGGGGLIVYIGQGSQLVANVTSNGDKEVIFTSTVNQNKLLLNGNSNFNGSVSNVSVIEITDDTNLPRIDYSPYSGAGTCGHWLFEPQSTQTATYSNDFTQGDIFVSSSDPTVQETVLTAQQATSPDGTNNAWKLVDNNDGLTGQASLNYFSTRVITNNYNTISYFVKKQGSNNFVYIATFGFDASSVGNTWFDIQNGTLGNVFSGHTANIENYGNGWYRISITMQSVTDIQGAFLLRLATSNGAGNILRDGTNGIYFFGVQAESDASRQFMTSYIPTSGSTVTRNQEAAFGSGNSSLINSTEGVLYADIAALANDSTVRRISLTDGTVNNRVEIAFFAATNRINVSVKANGTDTFTTSTSSYDITQFNKIAIKYKVNDFNLFINGVKLSSDTSGSIPTGLDTLNFDSGNGGFNFYGKTKCVAVFKEALTDDELECLTSDETSFSSFNALALANNYTII